MIKHNSSKPSGSDFLPDLCTVQAVFHLIIVGELLAIALTVSRAASEITWYQFGLISMMIQWVVLTSAACLCPLRRWFRRWTPEIAGGVSYGIVLSVTAIFSTIGVVAQSRGIMEPQWHMVYVNVIIAAVFAGIVLRYFYLQQQLRNQQQSELESRIQALQSRIRPHFLFNSMNSIASLIEIDPQLAERLIEDLSDLFRASFSEPGLVSIESELDLCRRFSRIEQTRLGNRLQMNWSVKGEISEVEVPSLLLQPLVENAIYHGVQPLPEGGVVDVDVHVVGGDVRIAVSNPMPREEPSGRRTSGNGIAMENMKNRLEAYYGGAARTFIVAQAGRFSVQLQFPTSVRKNGTDARL